MSVQDRQNRVSLRLFRTRFLNRADSVLSNLAFQKDMGRLKAEWNSTCLDFPVRDDSMPSDPFTSVLWNEVKGTFFPKGLLASIDVNDVAENSSTLRMYSRWHELVEHIRDTMFRPDLFPTGVFGPDSNHPASAFASACVVFTLWSVDPPKLIRELVPPIFHLTHPPISDFRLWEVTREAGRAKVLASALAEILADEPDVLREIEARANVGGHELQTELLPYGLWGVRQPIKDRWYFVPITPEMSGVDLHNLADKYQGFSSEVFGDAPLDKLIYILADENRPQKDIANQLGVSIETVSTALKNRTS